MVDLSLSLQFLKCRKSNSLLVLQYFFQSFLLAFFNFNASRFINMFLIFGMPDFSGIFSFIALSIILLNIVYGSFRSPFNIDYQSMSARMPLIFM